MKLLIIYFLSFPTFFFFIWLSGNMFENAKEYPFLLLPSMYSVGLWILVYKDEMFKIRP